MTGLQTGHRANFVYLFVALLVLTVVGPIVAATLGSVGIFVIDVSLSIALVIALWSLRSSRRVFFGGTALVAVNLLATAVSLVFGVRGASTVSDLSGLAFLVLSAVAAVRQVFRLDRVDLNKITGALCVYVLMGAIWAVLFQLLEGVVPGSFSGLEQHQGQALSWRLLYFSFVTLTTLGYGVFCLSLSTRRA